MDLSAIDSRRLIDDIARRALTTKQLCRTYGCTTNELRQFVEDYKETIELAREAYELDTLEHQEPHATSSSSMPNPTQLADLWISNKFERLRRYQLVAEALFPLAKVGDAVGAREFRTYMRAAAEELGQLLQRGAGEVAEGDTLSVDIKGIDMDSLR